MVHANVSSLAKGYHISKTILGSCHPFIASVSDREIHKFSHSLVGTTHLRSARPKVKHHLIIRIEHGENGLACCMCYLCTVNC